jgi:ribonuclease D
MTIELYRGDLPAGLKLGPVVAVDTETMGLNPLRDRLCLVQLSQGDGICHMVQIAKPAAAQQRAVAPNLKALLEDRSLLKLFHFARFDLSALKVNLDIDCAPVYCTKIAAKLVRTFTDRHGLKDLCRELLGVDLSKQQQTSDWGAETLSQEQLKYAAADVLYLHQLKEKLDSILDREGRRSLAEGCFGFLPTRAALDRLGWDQPDVFEH